MGKPIAGQNQFPYTIGGFLVDGANINGTTYAKKLYIYKQRSYSLYDLIDIEGNIYQFIRITYKNNVGEILNYFDVAENLVDTIPVNTFFLKIQDPSRNIFSFVRIYQWHKCITVEGDYVYRTAEIDPRLSGVFINPSISTVAVGKTLSYKSLFFPSNYNDLDGNWYMNSIDSITDNLNASIISSDLNTALVKGNNVGKSVLSFVPKRNDALVTHSIINIVESLESIELFNVFNSSMINSYVYDEEYTLEVVTYPYNTIIEEPLEISFETNSWENVSTQLISVSSDNKKYTFKTTYTGREEDKDYSSSTPMIHFKMDSPIQYTYTYSDLMVSGDNNYKSTYDYPGTIFQIPSFLRPNMTYVAKKIINGPNTDIYPYVSSDDDIATFDSSTGTLMTYNKKGSVKFTTKYMSLDGILTDIEIFGLTIKDEVYDQILVEPQQITSMHPGQSIQYKFTGYREGYDPINIPLRSSIYPNNYTIDTNSGVVTINENAQINSQVYIWPEQSLSVDLQLLSTYKSPSVKPLVQLENTTIDVTSLDTSVSYSNNIIFIRLVDDEFVNLTNFIIFPRPNNATNFEMQFDSYDEDIIEVVDKDYLLNSFQYSMRSLYTYIKAVQQGSTEIIISSVNYPDVKVTLKVVVY